MPTSIEIANIGLVALGERPIASFSGATTLEAMVAAGFRPALREVLLLFPWSAAAARASLPALAAAPWGWSAAFQAPIDCIEVRAVRGLTGQQWAREGATIVAEAEPPLDIFYTRDVSIDPTTGVPIGEGGDIPVGPALARLIGLRMALQIAEALTGTINRSQLVQAMYQQARAEAMSADARGRPFVTRNEWP